MNKKFLLIFTISLIALQQSHAMHKSKSTDTLHQLDTFESALDKARELCIETARKALETARAKYSPEKIACVFDIDGTCIESEESFGRIIDAYTGEVTPQTYFTVKSPDTKIPSKKYNYLTPPINAQVLDLSLWASECGFKVVYLSARKEDKEKIQQELYTAGFTNISQAILICQTRTERKKNTNAKKIGAWKQEQQKNIKKNYNLDSLIFIDDLQTNIDPTQKWQFLFPSAVNNYPPAQERRATFDFFATDPNPESDESTL